MINQQALFLRLQKETLNQVLDSQQGSFRSADKKHLTFNDNIVLHALITMTITIALPSSVPLGTAQLQNNLTLVRLE